LVVIVAPAAPVFLKVPLIVTVAPAPVAVSVVPSDNKSVTAEGIEVVEDALNVAKFPDVGSVILLLNVKVPPVFELSRKLMFSVALLVHDWAPVPLN